MHHYNILPVLDRQYTYMEWGISLIVVQFKPDREIVKTFEETSNFHIVPPSIKLSKKTGDMKWRTGTVRQYSSWGDYGKYVHLFLQ